MLLRFLGFAFLATGAGAITDMQWNQGDFSEVYTATTLALALPTAFMSIVRVAAFTASNLAALPDSIAAAGVSPIAAMSTLPRPLLLRMASGFATLYVVVVLPPFLGGWKALASYAGEKAQGSANFRRTSTKKIN